MEFVLDSLIESLGCDGAMHCRYCTDEDTREPPEQFCRLFSNLALCDCARQFASSCGRRPVIAQCFADSACCDRIVPFDWYGIHVYRVMDLVSGGF